MFSLMCIKAGGRYGDHHRYIGRVHFWTQVVPEHQVWESSIPLVIPRLCAKPIFASHWQASFRQTLKSGVPLRTCRPLSLWIRVQHILHSVGCSSNARIQMAQLLFSFDSPVSHPPVFQRRGGEAPSDSTPFQGIKKWYQPSTKPPQIQIEIIVVGTGYVRQFHVTLLARAVPAGIRCRRRTVMIVPPPGRRPLS